MLNNDSSDSDQTSNYNLKEEINNGNEQERSIAGSRMKYETNSSSDSNKNLQQSDNDTLEGPSDNDLSGNDNQGNKNIKQYQSSLFNRKRDNTHNLNERQQHYYSSQQLKRQSDDSLLDAIESFEPLSTRKTASITRGEATLLDIMETPNRGKEYLMDTDNGRNVGENEYDKLNRSKPVNPSVEKINTSFVSNPVLFPENMQSSSPWVLTRLLSTTGTPQQIRRTPMKKQQRSKIPVRSASSSQSRSRSISHSPATRKRTINNVVDINGHQTSLTSKIPVRIKTEQSQHTEKASAANYPPVTEKGAFRLFTSNENLHSESDVLSVFERGKAYYNQQDPPTTTSPFVPINSVNQQKIAPEAKQSNASTKHRLITRNAISADGHYKSKTATATTNLTSAIDPGRLTSQQYLIEDSDDTSSIETKSKAELATQLKEEKRHYKKTATILNQLHENYGQLLEKYAQAENTIDQLRFQPKLYDNSTPPANVIEGSIHFIHQQKYHTLSSKLTSNSITPSSTRQVTSSTTTTTAKAGYSPYSAIGEGDNVSSVFFDEIIPQRITVQELSTPETIKLDLLIQTKNLSEKMRSFLTLMDANQLSITEQKQLYESIKQDYENLLKALNNAKRSDEIRRSTSESDSQNIDLDTNLDTELETMKQLLKEIVKRITENLLGKTGNGSEGGIGLSAIGSQSSEISTRSSLINHDELMDQYQKLLTAVNASDRKEEMKSLLNGLDNVSGKLRKAMSQSSYNSPRSDVSRTKKDNDQTHKPYVYTSGNSDDEQCSTPEQFETLKRMETASFGLESIDLQRNGSRVERINQVDEQRSRPRTSKHELMDTQTPKNRRHRKPMDDEQNTILYDNKKPEYKDEEEQHNSLDDSSRTRRKSVRHTPIGGSYNREERNTKSNNQHNQKVNKHEVNKSSASPTISKWRGTRTSDHDSGIGSFANTTKLSRETYLQDRSITDNLDESTEYHQTNKSINDELFHSASHTKQLKSDQNFLSKSNSSVLKKKSSYQPLTDITKDSNSSKYYHSDKGRKYSKQLKSALVKRSHSAAGIYNLYSTEEDGLNSVTSSRSSGQGAESPALPYHRHEHSKYGENSPTRRSRKYSVSIDPLRHENDFVDNYLYRRKSREHSDLSHSDIETRVTGSFENLNDSNELYYKDRLSYLHWTPDHQHQSPKNHLYRQVLSKHIRRSHSEESVPLNKIPPASYYYRPQTAPSSDKYVNMDFQYQSSDRSQHRRQQQHIYYNDNRSRRSGDFPSASYRSSLYIPTTTQNNNRISTSIPSRTNQPTFVTTGPTSTNIYSSADLAQRNTHRSPLVTKGQPLRSYVPSQINPYSIRQQHPLPSPANDTLYLEPSTGIIYRYVANGSNISAKNQFNSKLIKADMSDVKKQKSLSRCVLCGSTTYHNHFQQQTIPSATYQSRRNNRSINDLDDGYESENRKTHRRGNRRRIAVRGVLYESHDNSYESSSGTDLNDTDYEALIETVERAREVQNRSYNLSRHIGRQVKLVLAS